MRLDAHDMTVLMNRHILPLGNSTIKHVDMTFGDGGLHMSGTMQKLGATLPFTAMSPIAAMWSTINNLPDHDIGIGFMT